MSDAVQVVRKQAGATIVKRGEQGNVFYMIAAGTVSVSALAAVDLNSQTKLSPTLAKLVPVRVTTVPPCGSAYTGET